MDWLQKYPKKTVQTEGVLKTESHYFNKKYSEISDNENEDHLDCDLFDNQRNECSEPKSDLQNTHFKVKDNIDDNKEEDVFDDEFDKFVSTEQFADQLVSEDYQRFDYKSNDSMEGMTPNTQNSMNSQCSQFALNTQWSLFVPTTQMEGKIVFTLK